MHRMKTEEVQNCMRQLMEAERLLDAERREDARAIITRVRAELAAAGDELTATVSLTWLFVERLEKRIG
jgi:hypothetical protein